MKRNRKLSAKRNAVTSSICVRIAGLALIAVVMTIFNVMENSRCRRLADSIGAKERVLNKLEDECQSESVKLNNLLTPRSLERALLKHGMAMRLPSAEQEVKMSANGRPYPGQMSIARLSRSGTVTAQVSPRRRLPRR